MSPLSEKSWRYKLFVKGTAREANYMSKESGGFHGSDSAVERIDPKPALDHPCKATCSGWRQGYERGISDSCEVINHYPESAEFVRDMLRGTLINMSKERLESRLTDKSDWAEQEAKAALPCHPHLRGAVVLALLAVRERTLEENRKTMKKVERHVSYLRTVINQYRAVGKTHYSIAMMNGPVSALEDDLKESK